MQIARVDPERSAEAVEAVHSSVMTFCALANTLGISFGLLQKRISGSVGIAGRVGLHRRFTELRHSFYGSVNETTASGSLRTDV